MGKEGPHSNNAGYGNTLLMDSSFEDELDSDNYPAVTGV